VALQAVGLTQRFGDRVALAGVDMTVRPGVLTGLLGPNGAGKTTLMRVMLGVIEPDAGEVLLDGRAVGFRDRQRWGYMPQDRGLYPLMPAGDQLVYMARLHGLDKSEATDRARSVMAELGLADRWDERVDKLSGGMQQRLQLGAAIVHDPDVIVLDEPFAGLDPVAVEELSVTLRDRVTAGRTVVFSSHQLDLVQDLCEEIVMIHQGRTVLAGLVADLRAASGRRQLRLGLDPGAPRDWLAAFPDVTVAADQVDAVRLEIPPWVDPLAVLDAARAAGPVTDFGLDLPTLSEMFLDAVGDRAALSEGAHA
jgi:ABC-2 type transport system ATP-binding protein